MKISKEKVRQILALAPSEWQNDVKDVHITESLEPANSRCWPGEASYNPFDRRLTIFGRGSDCEKLITPILSALAAHHLGFAFRRGNRLSDADTRKLARIVEPHAEHIIAQIQKPKNV